MRLSEILIIYMAIAAPHGVAFFLRQSPDESLSRRLIGASVATLLWPLAWTGRAGKHHCQHRLNFPAEDQTTNDARFAGTECATRELLAAFDDANESLRALGTEESELPIYEFRELLERYVGLTRIAAANSVLPSAREMETARLAGRRGDDLFLAGLCVHRRNNARLAAHLDSARTRFLQTLIELHREPYCPVRENSLAPLADTIKECDLSKQTLRVYARAIDLASLLEDRASALSLAPLLDAECARLRALEANAAKDTPTSSSREEETRLTLRAGHAVSTARLPNETFTQA